MKEERDKHGRIKSPNKDRRDVLAARVRKEIFARALIQTGNLEKAVRSAGYKGPARKVSDRLRKDPFVEKKINELLAEAYPVTKQAEDIADLVNIAVQKAKESDKLSEILNTIKTLSDLTGAAKKADEPVKKHWHLHAPVTPDSASSPGVVVPQLPKK